MINREAGNRVTGDYLRPEVQLQGLRDVLNNGQRPTEQQAFRKLVDRWLRVESLKRMFEDDRNLSSRFISDLWRDLDSALVANYKVIGKRAVWVSGFPPHPPVNPGQKAIQWFALLLLNPLCEKLAGPCDRCDGYFIKSRSNQKRFCGQRCAGLASAKRHTVAQARAERKALLEAATEVWPLWQERNHPNRSLWVADRVNAQTKKMKLNGRAIPVERKITQKWVTRNKAAIELAAAR
jgi:hypothetical protein